MTLHKSVFLYLSQYYLYLVPENHTNDTQYNRNHKSQLVIIITQMTIYESMMHEQFK